jgi:predicted aldo/keto reductase-like oxidoreductase
MKSTGDELSILGYGCMRFPRKNGLIDKKRTENQLISAIENGINYFDTAYLYPGSESALGKILANGYRDKVKIASKLPIASVKKREDMDKIFEKQLKRLQTDHIDYYLMHNICKFEEWEYLKEKGIISFIKKEQEKGRIINIGFSFHGNLSNFKKIVDDYPWDFCQIQYNYLDENYQAGTEGLDYAHSKGLGIVIMEPLRGGMLIDQLPPTARNIIKDFKPYRSSAEWAFRWIWNNPKVDVVLSGMNNEENIKENIAIASTVKPNNLNDEEIAIISSIKKEFRKKIKVNCSSCGYCLPCPQEIDIPMCFSYYNNNAMFKSIIGKMSPVIFYLMANETSILSKCTQCGKCEKKCPQHIKIIQELKNVDKLMNKWHYRVLMRIVKAIMYR